MINFYVIKLKRNFFPILFLFFTIGLFVFSTNNISSVKKGLTLWSTSVVPSLFPFFIATELLINTSIPGILGRIFNKFMKPIFNISGPGSFVFIMGLISGYPMGAKITCNFRDNNICSKEECERLLSFTNNSGPLFIIGTVGISLFKNKSIGILLFLSHIISALVVGFIFRFWKYNKNGSIKNSDYKQFFSKKHILLSNSGEIISKSISNSIKTILLVGGFIVLFSSIISICKSSGILSIFSFILTPIFSFLHIDPSFISPILTGILEITNGISSISNILCKKITINILITSFLLGLGGISIFMQVYSIVSKTDLSIKPYIYGKLLQSVISIIITYVLIQVFPIFNFDL